MSNTVLTVHIVGGMTGLATMVVPLVTKKGGPWHRRAGWGFVAGMRVSAASGLVLAVRFLVEGRLADGVFFGVLSLVLAEALWSGLAALRRKRRPEASRGVIDRGLPAVLFVASVAAALFGVLRGEFLIALFSGIGVANGAGSFRFAVRPLPSRMAWWYQHMSSMMTACITAVTAVLVVNAGRIFGPIPDAVVWVPWVLPSLIIVPPFVVWIRYYRAKFREAT